MEEGTETMTAYFKLSDSVLDMKEWLSKKWIRNPDTLILSLSGMYMHVHVCMDICTNKYSLPCIIKSGYQTDTYFIAVYSTSVKEQGFGLRSVYLLCVFMYM